MPMRAVLAVMAVAFFASCTSKDDRQRISKGGVESEGENGGYQIAVYYFPQYHVDARNEALWGDDWTEWQLVQGARSRFPGHKQPRVPAWGYQDEAEPSVMERKINAAANNGVTQFIFDWYWYEGAPFLHRALEEGYLHAKNRERVQFALMWANHDWWNLYPTPADNNGNYEVIWPGTCPPWDFERLTTYVIENYFKQDTYWKIDGKPYFSIYDMSNFEMGIGGRLWMRAAIARFRQKVRMAGFEDLHLNAISNGYNRLSVEELVDLGFDSVTHYTWIHHIGLPTFPSVDYAPMVAAADQDWKAFDERFTIPYFPNVSVGWDSTPRTVQDIEWKNLNYYPYTPVVDGNTPQMFRQALVNARRFVDSRNDAKIITINSWNEWTEGSYLEPDTEYGMQYLNAIRDVFGSSSAQSGDEEYEDLP